MLIYITLVHSCSYFYVIKRKLRSNLLDAALCRVSASYFTLLALEAIKKIASLEAELSKLRTQIANYALNHVDLDDTQLPCEHKAVSHMQHVYFVYTYVYILYLCTYVRMYVRTVLCISYIIVCL